MAEPKGTKGKPSIKKPKHACATKVEHPEWGAGNCLKEQHTLDEDGTVTHYDVMFDHGLEQNVSINELNVTLSEYHEHAINDTKNKEVLDEKKAKKDYDGDGKIESGKDEYFGSRDKAIKKAMGKKAMKKEHHEKDPSTGKVIPHSDEEKDKDLGGDGTPSSVEEGKKGLWDNIHAKRKRGEKPAKKGDKDYPKTLNVEGMKQARKNVGASTCWKGYKAKGTKKKGGKEVPNCVKEFAEWRKEVTEKKQ
jgi:hypothetical protein